jgi:hypothetical protein
VTMIPDLSSIRNAPPFVRKPRDLQLNTRQIVALIWATRDSHLARQMVELHVSLDELRERARHSEWAVTPATQRPADPVDLDGHQRSDGR